jgi:hypothetical protein
LLVGHASSTDSPSHFRFLDLPPEIRNMIYKEILVVGKIFYPELDPYDNRLHYDFDYKKPQFALLRVCKQIHSEAEPLYLGMNLFVLPNKFKDCRPFCEIGRDPVTFETRRFLFSKAAFTHVRNIYFAFTTEGNGKMGSSRVWAKYHSDPWAMPYAQLSDESRFDMMHQWRLHDAEDDWMDLQLSLCLFQSWMDYIEVDFSEAYCPVGCCRKVYVCTHRWILALGSKVLNVIGLEEEEKLSFSCADLQDGDMVRYEVDDLEAICGLHFMQPGEGTKWDAYKVEN